MSKISFNFSTAYESERKLRGIAELIEGEANRIQALIGNVETGWTGAGAEEYKLYLQELQKNILERSQRLYDIADSINNSINAAEEADREAARLLTEEAAAQSVYQPSTIIEPPQAQNDMTSASNVQNDSGSNQGAGRNAHSRNDSPIFGAAGNAINSVINRRKA